MLMFNHVLKFLHIQALKDMSVHSCRDVKDTVKAIVDKCQWQIVALPLLHLQILLQLPKQTFVFVVVFQQHGVAVSSSLCVHHQFSY